MVLHVLREVRAADLFLALEQELHVEWESASLRHERLRHFQHDEYGALVISDTSAARNVAVDGQLERRGIPFVEATRRLHVIVAINQNRGRARCLQPVRSHHRKTVRFNNPAIGERELIGEPPGGLTHRLGGGATAHAGNANVLGQFWQKLFGGDQVEFIHSCIRLLHRCVHPFSIRFRTSSTPARHTSSMSASERW